MFKITREYWISTSVMQATGEPPFRNVYRIFWVNQGNKPIFKTSEQKRKNLYAMALLVLLH